MNDPQNEPRTCPYCDQPRQDTFENRFRFECSTAVLKENGKTVKQSRECKLRVAYSKLLVDYCNLKEGAPSQATIDAAMADGAIVEPGDAARLQRIRERLSDFLPTGGGDVCPHGIRYPWECKECADAAWDLHRRDYESRGGDQQPAQTARECGKCGEPLGNTSALRHFGFYAAHQEDTCLRLLRDRADRAEAEMKGLFAALQIANREIDERLTKQKAAEAERDALRAQVEARTAERDEMRRTQNHQRTPNDHP